MVGLSILFYYVQTTWSYRFLPAMTNESYMYMNSNNSITNIEYVPHHVLVVHGISFCSGSLIGSRTVVTAASCFDNNKDDAIIVKLGSNSIISNGQVISVTEYKVHEYYKYLNSLDNDIALLMLKDDAFFGSQVKKVLIIESEVALMLGVPVIVTGWGGSELPIKYLNMIVQSEMVVVNNNECVKQFGGLMTSSNYCAKYNTFSERLGDNGGGAVFNNLLVGVLSYGTNTHSTVILTNVSYFYRWIVLNTKRFLIKHCQKNEQDKNGYDTDYNET